MYYQKPSTNLLRMIISIRNTLDEIENGKPTSFNECRRLELLEKVQLFSWIKKFVINNIRTCPFSKDLNLAVSRLIPRSYTRAQKPF